MRDRCRLCGGHVVKPANGEVYDFPRGGRRRGPNHITTCTGLTRYQRTRLADAHVCPPAVLEAAYRDVYAGDPRDVDELDADSLAALAR